MSKKMYVHKIKANRKMKDPHTKTRKVIKKEEKKCQDTMSKDI